jgi:S-adenosylmethionine:diacylglycerol 3-amino-3-carboxypropyl transferase
MRMGLVAEVLNRAHLILTRLKIVALQRLPDKEAFSRFFGLGA